MKTYDSTPAARNTAPIQEIANPAVAPVSQLASSSPRQVAQGARIAQLGKKKQAKKDRAEEGKEHHDPRGKKYLGKGVGSKQVEVSKRQLDLVKSTGMSRKEAKRQAKDELN